MALVEDYHYKLVDDRGVLQGYFETEGQAHQYLLEEYPWPKDKRDPGYKGYRGFQGGQVMPFGMFIHKVRRK